MTRERLDLGKEGEELALKKIKRLGYRCITRNYRCALGEVDLIASHGDCLVFMEIKTRTHGSLGYAKEAVDIAKKVRRFVLEKLPDTVANDPTT